MAFSPASIASIVGPAAQAYGLWSSRAGLDDIDALLERLCHDSAAPPPPRMRARVALFGTRALGAPVAFGVGWAAACELVHHAALLHDDERAAERCLTHARDAIS